MRNHIRLLRAERRWSQADLADRIGVSRQTINAIENGRYDPSLSLAFRLGEVFERPIERLFEYGDEASDAS
ncbi:MAG: helix-turn-helix transcriptional regulator [bacterium]